MRGPSAVRMRDRQKFAVLRAARRVWAIASVHGEAERLDRIHAQLETRLRRGDRVVYLGNLIGRGAQIRQTLDRVVEFRRGFLALHQNFPEDIAYLRGGQEEMWQKLLQLQFASDPRGVLNWMLEQGVDATLEAYGSNAVEGLREAASGPLQLTRWTGRLRSAIQDHPGHYQVMNEIRRAAYTQEHSLLFVNTGLDPTRPLETQRDSFWWGSGAFSRIGAPYGDFGLVVRGFDPSHPGQTATDFTLTLDAGCGFGGPLLAACILPSGEVVETLEA